MTIDRVAGRLPSEKLGLHLEQAADQLRLFDPVAKRRLLTPRERADQETVARIRAEADRDRALAQNELLRLEIEALKRRLGGNK